MKNDIRIEWTSSEWREKQRKRVESKDSDANSLESPKSPHSSKLNKKKIYFVKSLRKIFFYRIPISFYYYQKNTLINNVKGLTDLDNQKEIYNKISSLYAFGNILKNS